MSHQRCEWTTKTHVPLAVLLANPYYMVADSFMMATRHIDGQLVHLSCRGSVTGSVRRSNDTRQLN